MENTFTKDERIKYAKLCHTNAKDNGWWDKEIDHTDLLRFELLVYSEMFEAFEAIREDRFAKLSEEGYDAYRSMSKDFFKGSFKEFVKDTLEDEIADIAIRAFDLAGYRMNINHPKETIMNDDYENGSILYIPKSWSIEFVIDVIRRMSYNTLYILQFCSIIADHYEFDLKQHMELKMKYNKTRGYKHGNKTF